MELTCKTQGNSDSKGKPKVYFFAHPDDYPLYFEAIARDIFATQNCAIYYDPRPDQEYDREELYFQLGLMQLFVFPVTTRFLCQPNRAREVELPFALERHIPLLPLMQESGLEELFNKTCGSIQILGRDEVMDEKSIAGNVLSYPEKLKHFLNSVLIGDELASRVRSAFDAYVFLSYRKKDRTYAQKLMRLIHHDDFCRDIAIWYDEFLAPGEDFNAAISKALEKSDIFTLTVTPRLLEDENYVMTQEYPMAKSADKPVLPVEMIQTEPNKLKANYQGIDDCVDAGDQAALSDFFKKNLRDIAVRENDQDPEHNFLIGLAYLGGIDMEVDLKKAASLITGAAQAGLPEAMERLTQMYKNGMGVERNYRKAAEWQEKLAECWKSRHNNEEWAKALMQLGDDWYEIRELARAQRAYEELQQAVKGAEKELSDRYQPYIWARLGDVYRESGMPDKALSRYHFATPYQHERPEIACYIHDRMGDIYIEKGDFENAGRICQENLEICKERMSRETSIECYKSLINAFLKAGDVLLAQENISEAREQYNQALLTARQMSQEICQDIRGPEILRGLALCLRKLGDAAAVENSDAAESFYRQSLDYTRRLEQQTESIRSREELSYTLGRLGDILKRKGALTEAADCYRQSMEIRKRLAIETRTIANRTALARCYERAASIDEELGHTEEASLFYSLAEEIRQGLPRKAREAHEFSKEPAADRQPSPALSPQDDTQESDPATISVSSRDYLHTGDLKNAVRLWYQENSIPSPLEEGSADGLNQAYSLYQSAFRHHAAGNTEAAKEALLKSIDIYSRYTRLHYSGIDEAHSHACVLLGDLFDEEDETLAAIPFYEKALLLVLSYEQESPSGLQLFEIAQAAAGLCRVYMAVYPSAAMILGKKAAGLFQALLGHLGEENDVELHKSLSATWHNIGEIAENSGDLETAVSYFLESIHHSGEYYAATGNPEVLFDIVEDHHKAGKCFQRSGNYPEARKQEAHCLAVSLSQVEAGFSKHKEAPHWLPPLFESIRAMVSYCAKMGDRETQEGYFNLLGQVGNQQMRQDWEVGVAHVCCYTGVDFFRLGLMELANEHLLKSIDYTVKILDRNPLNTFWRERLGEAWKNLAVLEYTNHNLEREKKCYEIAADQYLRLLRLTGETRFGQILSNLLTNIFHICKELKDEEGMAYYWNIHQALFPRN